MIKSVCFLPPEAFDPCSHTVPEGLRNLRILREELKNMMDHLNHQLESQKQTSERMKIRMVSVYTVYGAQSGDPNYNTLNLNIFERSKN